MGKDITPEKKSGTATDKKKKQSGNRAASPVPAPKKKKVPSNAAMDEMKSVIASVKDELDDTSQALQEKSFELITHLDKFRSQILFLGILFIVLTCVGFYFSDSMVYYLNKPFIESGNRLNIFTLTGGFMLRLKVSAYAAILVMIPIILFSLWKIISPMVGRTNRWLAFFVILSANVLFYGGVAFVFFFLVPAAISVLLGFIGKDMVSMIGADNYLDFITFTSLIMGVLFEVPIITLVLTKIGILNPEFLIKKRKFAIVIAWVIAAIVTPQPDPLSQSMVGVPLMIIFEVSILVSRLVARSKRKTARA